MWSECPAFASVYQSYLDVFAFWDKIPMHTKRYGHVCRGASERASVASSLRQYYRWEEKFIAELHTNDDVLLKAELFTDGSGYPANDPRTRRTAWASIIENAGVVSRFAAGPTLGGAPHSAPSRALRGH